MYVSRNIEARSRNHSRRGKAINSTHLCACVYVWVGMSARELVHAFARVALLIQHEERRHSVICGLS